MQCYQCGGTTKLESSYRLFPYMIQIHRCGVCGSTAKQLHAIGPQVDYGSFRLTTGAELFRRQQAVR